MSYILTAQQESHIFSTTIPHSMQCTETIIHHTSLCCRRVSHYLLENGGDGQMTPLLRLGSGACAGIIGMTATYPLDMVRGRLTVQAGKEYTGILHATRMIVKQVPFVIHASENAHIVNIHSFVVLWLDLHRELFYTGVRWGTASHFTCCVAVLSASYSLDLYDRQGVCDEALSLLCTGHSHPRKQILRFCIQCCTCRARSVGLNLFDLAQAAALAGSRYDR